MIDTSGRCGDHDPSPRGHGRAGETVGGELARALGRGKEGNNVQSGVLTCRGIKHRVSETRNAVLLAIGRFYTVLWDNICSRSNGTSVFS